MSILTEIDDFIKKHVTTSDTFSRLWLPAWCLASWVPNIAIPPLFIQGPGKAALLQCLSYLCQEVLLKGEQRGLSYASVVVSNKPIWDTESFKVQVESTGVEPMFDLALYIRIGAWAREHAQTVQDVYWALLKGELPDPLAGLTAVLLVSAGGADGKTNASSFHGVSQQLGS
jgi:hypothetical protein